MAQRPPTTEFEDVPPDEAPRMSRGARMAPTLYTVLKQKIRSLGNAVTRVTIDENTAPTKMENRLLRVAAALGVLVNVRKVPEARSSGV